MRSFPEEGPNRVEKRKPSDMLALLKFFIEKSGVRKTLKTGRG